MVGRQRADRKPGEYGFTHRPRRDQKLVRHAQTLSGRNRWQRRNIWFIDSQPVEKGNHSFTVPRNPLRAHHHPFDVHYGTGLGLQRKRDDCRPFHCPFNGHSVCVDCPPVRTDRETEPDLYVFRTEFTLFCSRHRSNWGWSIVSARTGQTGLAQATTQTVVCKSPKGIGADQKTAVLAMNFRKENTA